MTDSNDHHGYRYSRPNPPVPSKEYAERFWGYVLRGKPDECWPWRTLKVAKFWWRASDGSRCYEKASRLAYRLGNDGCDIPPDRVIGHTCDWDACCNPAHLECVTQKKNSQDMADRDLHPYSKSGRYRYTRKLWSASSPATMPGEGNGFARLTDEQVAEIRARYASGLVRQVDLAKEYGIAQSHVSRLVRGESWSHLGA